MNGGSVASTYMHTHADTDNRWASRDYSGVVLTEHHTGQVDLFKQPLDSAGVRCSAFFSIFRWTTPKI